MPDPRPNIVLVMTDQQRLDTIRSMGNSIGAQTPAMDGLVREGVTFTNAFCTAPVCGPSRASMMTGLFPSQTGIYANLGTPCQPLNTATTTLANRMQSIGYETAYHGKWHLGGDLRDYGWEQAYDSGHDPSTLAEAARFYRRDWLQHKRPFFQVVSFLNPHDLYFFDPADVPDDIGTPWPGQDDPMAVKPQPQRHHQKRDWPQSRWAALRKFYARRLEIADRMVGELLDELVCSGFGPNTWVIFTADHGDSTGNNGLPFKGPWMYDSVLRVPLILVPPRTRFAGKGKGSVSDDAPFAGRRCGALASLIDLVPTVLDLAGAAADPVLPGRSLVPQVLTPQTQPAGHQAVFAEWHQSGRYVTPIRTIRTREWKYNRYLGYGEELYDLAADPLELTNLAGQPAHAATQHNLARQLDAHLTGTRDPFYSHTPTDPDGVPLPLRMGDTASP